MCLCAIRCLDGALGLSGGTYMYYQPTCTCINDTVRVLDVHIKGPFGFGGKVGANMSW